MISKVSNKLWLDRSLLIKHSLWWTYGSKTTMLRLKLNAILDFVECRHVPVTQDLPAIYTHSAKLERYTCMSASLGSCIQMEYLLGFVDWYQVPLYDAIHGSGTINNMIKFEYYKIEIREPSYPVSISIFGHKIYHGILL